VSGEHAGAAAGIFLARRSWGALSVPRKKRGLPLVRAEQGLRSRSRFKIGSNSNAA